MRTERLLAGLAALVACLAAVSGGPVVQQLVTGPIAAEFSLPGEELPARAADPEEGQARPTRTSDPADAFRSPLALGGAADGPAPSESSQRGVAEGPGAPAGSGAGQTSPEPTVTEVPVFDTDLALTLPDAEPESMSPHQAALAWLATQRGLFGVGQPGRSLRPFGAPRVNSARVAVDFQQMLAGVPVLGGRVSVTMNRAHVVQSASGQTTSAPPSAVVAAQVGAEAARTAALQAVSERAGAPVDVLQTSVPRLWFVDPALVPAAPAGPARPMWQLTVASAGADSTAVGEALVDARTGIVTVVQVTPLPATPPTHGSESPAATPSATAEATGTAATGPSLP